MSESLLERVWSWLHATFPERQIYIRSDGRVQFFTFGATLQATLAGLSLIFLLWVAFATVNVVFKDRIIAAKDHRYQQMQAAYENRVADLQISYDELNGALINAEGNFHAKADTLQKEQTSIVQFLDRKKQVKTTLASLTKTGKTPPLAVQNITASDGIGLDADKADNDALEDADNQPGGSSNLAVMPEPAPPQPRTARTKSSFLDGIFTRLKDLLTDRHTPEPANMAAAYAKHPALRAIAAQTQRLAQLSNGETALMRETKNELKQSVSNLQSVISDTGIDPKKFEHKVAASEGMGGPDIPLTDVSVAGLPGSSSFRIAYLRADAVLNQLDGLISTIRHIPLDTPVSGPQFVLSSGFGPRIDPFTGHYSFHPGIDLAGPWGSLVHATAPGTVVFAGPRGGYGNMVEINDGFGIHTRYGHLSSILTHVGAKVAKGTPIGKLGSTGRSTGPHVHYEVWYDHELRNPEKFIEAGHHVL